jgi:type I restriction enzyme S subunit
MGSLGHLSHLNLGYLRDFRIPCPAVEEQREIVNMLDAIDRKIDLHRRKRAVLNDLFKMLLHKLMTGEICVADLNLSALDRLQVAPTVAGV